MPCGKGKATITWKSGELMTGTLTGLASPAESVEVERPVEEVEFEHSCDENERKWIKKGAIDDDEEDGRT